MSVQRFPRWGWSLAEVTLSMSLLSLAMAMVLPMILGLFQAQITLRRTMTWAQHLPRMSELVQHDLREAVAWECASNPKDTETPIPVEAVTLITADATVRYSIAGTTFCRHVNGERREVLELGRPTEASWNVVGPSPREMELQLAWSHRSHPPDRSDKWVLRVASQEASL